MRYNLLFAGPAGSGPNFLANFLAEALVKILYYVFSSRDYQSLIRGGHNFNVLTFSENPVYSNDSKIDILICLDEESEKKHKQNLCKQGVILKGHKENMYYAGRIFRLLGFSLKDLEIELNSIKGSNKENLEEAKLGFNDEEKKICSLKEIKKKLFFSSGSQGISSGAIESGLNVYYAYPMTPATPVLTELAQKQAEEKFIVLELESEIAVINAALGSAITGAKAMVGTSGGGFDLMTEAMSMAGMAEIPIVMYLSQRPGPGTGVPTYTSQGDLSMARHSGHGEFPRLVLAPGDSNECAELTSQAFYFSQKYKTPAIVISDKHLAESSYSLEKKPVITKSGKITKLGRYNSYERDSYGNSTDDPKIINENMEKRLEK
ncbi:MAG: 2-oxoacid:acceptor oxidoreductase family protein, partial [Nanoarchaeota archaeon]